MTDGAIERWAGEYGGNPIMRVSFFARDEGKVTIVRVQAGVGVADYRSRTWTWMTGHCPITTVDDIAGTVQNLVHQELVTRIAHDQLNVGLGGTP